MNPLFDILTGDGAAGVAPVQRGGMAQLVEQIKLNRGGGVFDPGPNRAGEVVVVFASVNYKANAFAQLPLRVSTAEDRIVESGPLVDISEQPNPKMTGRAFRKATSAMIDLFGQVHWVFTLDASGRPVEVYPISPVQMKAVRNQTTGELLAWEFYPQGRLRGEKRTLTLEEVHTIRDPDFEDGDELAAISPRHAARRAISQYWKSDWANEASLDNGVEPGGIFTIPGEPHQDQLRDAREQIAERNTGVRNRRRHLLLYGGMTFESIAASFKDMEFSELKRMHRQDICAAFGVPPALIGYLAEGGLGSGKEVEQAREGFWIETVLPLGARIAEEWNAAILDRHQGNRALAVEDAKRRSLTEAEAVSWGHRRAFKAAGRGARRFYAWFDDSGVPAVQRARLAGVEQAAKWNSIGVPTADIIEATDAPFPVRDWQKTWHKPIGLVDVQDDMAAPDAQDPDGSEEEAGLLGRDRTAPVDLQRSESTRAQLWRQWRASWAGLERLMRGKLNRHFYALRQETLAKLAAAFPQIEGKALSPDQRRDVLAEVLFDIVKANGELLRVAGPVLREAHRLGGEQVMQEAADATGGAPQAFDASDPDAVAALRRRNVEITGINRTLQTRLRERIGEALDAGTSMAEMQDLIREEFNFAGTRSATIARTEVSSAIEESRHIGRRQAGVPLKSWLSSRKETGRPSHAATEAATLNAPVDLEEDFVIAGTGVTCPHPRATGQAAHDINCGCTTLSRYPGDSIKAVLERYARRGFLSYGQLAARDGSRAGQPGEDSP